MTPWAAAYQALSSMGFSRHEYWSGVPLLSPKLMLLLLFSGILVQTEFASAHTNMLMISTTVMDAEAFNSSHPNSQNLGVCSVF